MVELDGMILVKNKQDGIAFINHSGSISRDTLLSNQSDTADYKYFNTGEILNCIFIFVSGGKGPEHEGVCSAWLNRLQPGDDIPCSVRTYV